MCGASRRSLLKKFARLAAKASQARTSMKTLRMGSSSAHRIASSAMQPPKPAARMEDFTNRGEIRRRSPINIMKARTGLMSALSVC